ncbi:MULTISPECIES: EamA family transporter [Microbacterium]|uniref:DMT family transporter n=1 Tax=Microbacterium aquilitoris TaxID=3067307 RepID=A0ABU3GLF9_9MICO|nr:MULTISPECIES: DMT family transporter [unclassified Microbacterium]MDT3331538.1 DMT family transporter [Microbacterium sp. KSW-18]MDT3343691.1 DMT family transporter [Microbacterium sp. KSW2-22]
MSVRSSALPARGTVPPSGLVLAVVSALTFSVSGPIAKPLLEGGWSLAAVLAIRMGVAGLVLSPALIRTLVRRRDFLRVHWLSLVAFGLIPVVGCQIFYFSALQRMPVGIALLIQYLAPVMLVLFVWARTRRAPSRVVIVGSVVAMTGLVLVVDIAGARFDLLGTVFALLAAVCACVYFVMSERTGDDLPPLSLAAGGLLIGTVTILLLAAVGILPLSASAAAVDVLGATVSPLVPLVLVGLCTATGYALGIMAVPRIGSRLASFVGLSEVLFALSFAWLLLGEAPAGVQFAGGALILAGVILVRLEERAPADVSSPAEPLPGEVAPGIR